MFETIIDVYSRYGGDHLITITVETKKRLTEQDCRKAILEYGFDLGLTYFDFVSMRVRPSLPPFLKDEFKLAEKKFHDRLKSRR